jgi:hypothetical protein
MEYTMGCPTKGAKRYRLSIEELSMWETIVTDLNVRAYAFVPPDEAEGKLSHMIQ